MWKKCDERLSANRPITMMIEPSDAHNQDHCGYTMKHIPTGGVGDVGKAREALARKNKDAAPDTSGGPGEEGPKEMTYKSDQGGYFTGAGGQSLGPEETSKSNKNLQEKNLNQQQQQSATGKGTST
ncbi:hypothetical protein QOT17_023605 [Balamuthia mandrillaris]